MSKKPIEVSKPNQEKRLEIELNNRYKQIIQAQELLAEHKQEVIEAMAIDCARHYNRIFGSAGK